MKKIAKALAIAFTGIVLGGCATTQVTIHAVGNRPPLCRAGSTPHAALVLWGTAWREDQKEVALREEMASRAISRFFRDSLCYSKVEVLKSIAGRPAAELSDTDALKLAASTGDHFDRVILVRLEELGPFIHLYLSPVFLAGGTEAVLRIRVLAADTSALEADVAIHWMNGGAFVLKGTKTLDQDLQAALASVFLGSPGNTN